MRTTLAASMLNAISRNEKQGTLEGRLFEVASIYIPESLPLTSYPDERKVLCVGTFGNNESFFTMKGIANTIAESMDIEFTYEPVQKSFLHPYQAVKVLCEGTEIGYFGKAAYDIQNELSMRASAYIMELDLKELSRWYGKNAPSSRSPNSRRRNVTWHLSWTKHQLRRCRELYPRGKQIRKRDPSVRCLRGRPDSGRQEEHGVHRHLCTEGRSI